MTTNPTKPHFRPGDRIRNKKTGQCATVTEDGARKDGDSYSSWFNPDEWEVVDMTIEIINTRMDAIEEVLQLHNQWIADLMSDEKHCPFCLEKLAELNRRLTELQGAVLRSQNLTFGSD